MNNTDNNEKIRLLLVEDERTLASIIADTLSEKGFEVRCAYNGADGLRAAAEFRPEVVVTDIMMPTMDGFTFVKRLRVEGICGDDVPVLFLSAPSRPAPERRTWSAASSSGPRTTSASPSP